MSVAITDTPIDRATWRVVWLVREDEDGNGLEIGLLRSPAWLADRGIACPGDVTTLSMPEMGADGEFQVVAIEPCPEIEGGPGRVITGVFRHRRGRVYDLRVEGEPDAIGVTARHPFWSVDRGDWVAAGDLHFGERLSVSGGTAVVRSVTERGEEPVYNLEVDVDRCYRVGNLGVLVHNVSISQCQFLTDDITTYKDSIKYFDTEAVGGIERATRVQARLGKWNIGKGEDAEYDPPGYDASLNPPAGGTAKVARGHLLANILGGAGSKTNPNSKKNLVPICHISTNLPMASRIEVPVKKLLADPKANNIADYEVWATYGFPAHPAIPSKITIKARVYNCSTGVCTPFDGVFSNLEDLSKCPGPATVQPSCM